MPRVSVIMGIYNEKNKDNVIKAIDSILKQTYKDFEFIICDDGSSDKSGEICDRFKLIDDRIIVIHKNKQNMFRDFSNMERIQIRTLHK